MHQDSNPSAALFSIRLLACFLFAGFALYSCKKEYSCENCLPSTSTGLDKPPVARAGNDQTIHFPKDSVLLNGSASTDADGTIIGYQWTKISGPQTFVFTNASSKETTVKDLAQGSYTFELKITDNDALTARDTVIVTVVATTNQPPLANAGQDQGIILPVNTLNLDGRGSTDPENNITSYLWTKISGPSTFNLTNPTLIQTQATALIQGIYQFELLVTDAGGLFSKDTLEVTVNAPLAACPPSDRPSIKADLIHVGLLSEARTGITVASAGNKIVFAGGRTTQTIPSSTVDIYDISSNTWTKAQLTVARSGIGAIAVGNKIYFAGGVTSSFDSPSSRIDIYDVASNTWSTAELSEARGNITVASVGNKILFAGGRTKITCSYCTSDKVDIYDMTANTWSEAALSVARVGLSATTASNKIYFAGGHEWSVGSGVYDQIDIYDDFTNTWSVSKLIERKAHHASFVEGNYIYWAGGETFNNYNDYETTCMVEKRDLINGTSTTMHLFQPNFTFSSGYNVPIKALMQNGLVVLYTGFNQFDIFDPLTNLWSIGTMNRSFYNAGVISVNNTIYITGGTDNSDNMSKEVWKLKF